MANSCEIKIPISLQTEELKRQFEELERTIKGLPKCEHKWKHAVTDVSFGVMYLYCERCGQAKTNNVLKTQ